MNSLINNKNIFINKSLLFFLFFYSSLFILSFTKLFTKNDLTLTSQYWSFIVIAILIHFAYLFYKKFKSYNYPFLFFVAGIIICWFGQVFIASFGYLSNPTLTVFEFDAIGYFNALQYSSIAFFVFCSVGLIFTKKNNYTNISREIKDSYLRKSANYSSIIFLLISGPLFFRESIANLYTSISRGYASIYQNDTVNQSYSYGIINTISELFIPALLIFFVANKDSYKARIFVYLCFLYYLIISFATGSRGYAIALIISFLWLYFNEFKKYSLKNLALIAPLILFVAKISSVVAEFRAVRVKNLQVFIQLFIRPENENGFIIGSLREFGFNIFSLYNTMLIVPAKQAFSAGYSYLATVAVVLPKFFYGGYSFTNEAALARWLMNKLGLSYGPGFTFVAEAYYNFGWFGMFAVALISFLITKMLVNKESNSSNKSLRNAFVSVVIYLNLFIARDTSLFILRKYIYFVLIPSTLIFIIYQSLRARDGHA